MFQQAGPGSRSADASFSGDFNCDATVNTRDVIAALAVSGGTQALSSCANAVSVDCDGDTDVTDALLLLRHLASTSVSLPAACSDINSLIPGTSPQSAADQLSARVAANGPLVDVVQAVQESLARGGVSTGDSTGTIYTPASEPTARSVAIPLEVLNLALDARGASSYQMDGAQLGQMLADFGWPFLIDSTPGEQIVAMLQELVVGAQALPDDPNSFAPLFLQDMSQLRVPPVDLSTGNTTPESVHFNLLELRLLSAVFERQTVYPNNAALDLAVPAANEPCSDAQTVLNGAYGPFGGKVNGLLTSEAGPKFIEKALEKAGVKAGNIGKVGNALGALGIVSKIWKLLDFFASEHVDVKIIDGSNRLHKPLDTAADEERTFDATAGISQEDWDAYQQANANVGSETNHAVRDCLNQFGLNVFSDLGDIVKDAANWKIDWTISNNNDNSRHEKAITWDPGKQESGRVQLGLWRSDTVKTSEYAYEAAFKVDVGTELASDHLGHPSVKIDDVHVCANVISAQPPELSTFVNAMKGILGLVDAIVDLGAGWIRDIAPPQACRILTVLWHESCALAALSPNAGSSVSIQAVNTIADLPCEWTGTAHGKTHHYINIGNTSYYDEVGTIDGTFTFGNAKPYEQYNTVTYEVISGSATWHASGHVSCSFSKGGTEQLQGGLTIGLGVSGHLEYGGVVTTKGQDRITCGASDGEPIIETVDFSIGCSVGGPWVLDSLDVSGSCNNDNPQFWHDEFSWHLSGISCGAAVLPNPDDAATPEGVCGGP